MKALDDPGALRDIIVDSLDGEFYDGEDIFIDAETGGTGSTSATATVTVTDAEDATQKQIFYVTITMPEPDDDYTGEA